jgi:hypothetical protein
MKDLLNSIMWAVVLVVGVVITMTFIYYSLEGVRYVIEYFFPNLHWRWVILITLILWSTIYVSFLISLAKRLSSNAR